MEHSKEVEYEQLLQFVYACPVGLLEMSRDGGIKLMNPLAMNLVMPLSTDGIPTNLIKVFENYAPELRSLIEDFTAKRGTICNGHRIFVGPASKTNPDAQILSCTIVKLRHERYVVTLNDISQQVRQERRLREAETWFGSLLVGVKDFGVVSLGVNGLIDGVNSTLTRQAGYSETELAGASIAQLLDGDVGETFKSTTGRLAQARRDGWHLDEGWGLRKNGERYWCQSLIAVCADGSSQNNGAIRGYTVILREIERRDTDMLELKRLLQTDHLTGALNRGAFYDAAEREYLQSKRLGQPLSFLMFDLDNFKSINDTFGHSSGDDVLRVVSKVCQTSLRPGDTFARIGGEEFAIILPNTLLNDSVETAERIRALIASEFIATGGTTLTVTASFGCAQGTISTENAMAILAHADAAMYQAKRAGRNRTVPAIVKFPVI